MLATPVRVQRATPPNITDHSYCHIHIHCCGITGYLPAGLQVSDPASRALLLARFADALPLGGLVYPLLRPPRRSV